MPFSLRRRKVGMRRGFVFFGNRPSRDGKTSGHGQSGQVGELGFRPDGAGSPLKGQPADGRKDAGGGPDRKNNGWEAHRLCRNCWMIDNLHTFRGLELTQRTGWCAISERSRSCS